MGQNQSKTESFECCVGETIHLKYTNSGNSIQWMFNGKTILSNINEYTKNGAEYADIGKYECKINGKVECVFHVNVYSYMFDNYVLGIRMSVTDSHSSTGRTNKAAKYSNDEGRTNKAAKYSNDEGNLETLDSIVGETNMPSKSSNDKGDMKLTVFSMERNPRGIAVIIGIEKFKRLPDLPGVQKDIENCETTFSQLHFDVKVCSSTKAGDILAYLKNIANKSHANYDCFILYISAHGGQGFVCGSDYNKKKNRGFILIDTLIEMFLPKRCMTLKDKPKLFFFDCCRDIVSENKPSPIRPFKNEVELAKHYADIFIGYATITGTSAGIESNGSDYTNVLTTCINNLAPTNSFLDVMTEVACTMKKKHQQIAHHEATLGGQIIMKKLV